MAQWLLDRLFETKDQSKPQFAFRGSINWMRALAEIINDGSCNDAVLKEIYSGVRRRSVNTEADTLVFENMFMAFHGLASLNSMNSGSKHKYDICRSAIVSWYYTIYFSASAMIAATSGSVQETHAATAKVWQAEIIERDFIPYPFDLSLSSLVKKRVDAKIERYRGSNDFDLNNYPENSEQAHGAIVSYLKGTAEYKRWEVENRVRSTREFKDLDVSNFRKNVARELRDKHLDKGQVNYLIQAFRYRGKANYRDSIFLSYGDNNESKIDQFIQDLLDVSTKFVRIASFYSSKRVERDMWDKFIDDIEENSRLSINADEMRI